MRPTLICTFTISCLALLTAMAQTQTSEQPPLASVEGKVSSASGQPLPKANITMRPNGLPPQTTYSATSGADGTFQITGVEQGSYVLSAERTGYMPQIYGAKPGVRFAAGYREILQIQPGQKLTGRDIQMAPATTLSGKVLDEDGDPVGRAQVRVLRYLTQGGKKRLMMMNVTIADQTGEYRIANLSPGKYLLAATVQTAFGVDPGKRPPRKPGEEEHSYVETFYPGTIEAASASIIIAAAGRDLPGINIPLKKTAVYHVRGQVRGLPSGALARVYARGVDDLYMFNYAGGAPVQTDGTFDLPDVTQGAAAVVVVNQNDSFRVLARKIITVARDDVNDLVISITPPPMLSGQFRLEGDEPPADEKNPPKPPQFTAQFQPIEGVQSNGFALAKADADGRFTVPSLSPGKYSIFPNGGPAGSYWKATRRGTTDLPTNVLDTEDGSTEPIEIVFSRNGGIVDGVVTGGDKSPNGFCLLIPDVDDVLVRVLLRRGRIDASGHCLLKAVRPGSYRLFAMEDNDVVNGSVDPTELRTLLQGRGTTVLVKEKETAPASVQLISEVDLEKLAEQSGR